MINSMNIDGVPFYQGLSTDVKPSGKGLNGVYFQELDTGLIYVYDEENNIWRVL